MQSSNIKSPKSSSPTPPEQKKQLNAEYKEAKAVFNRQIIKNDGDCALTAMRLTRRQAVDFLAIEISQNAKVRNLIAPEIQAAFLENNILHIVRNTKAEKEVTQLLEQRKKLDTEIPTLMSKGKKLLSENDAKQANNLTSLLTILNRQDRKQLNESLERMDLFPIIQPMLLDVYSAEDKIGDQSAREWVNDAKRSLPELIENMKAKMPDVYNEMKSEITINCAQVLLNEVENLAKTETLHHEKVKALSLDIPVQESFLNKHIENNGWLTFNANSTSSIDAIAELFKKHLIIFFNDEKSDTLRVVHEYKSTKIESYEILFLTDHVEYNTDGSFKIHKNVHFDRLEPVDAVSFEKTIGFVRKSPSPIPSTDSKASDSVSANAYVKNNMFSNPALNSKYKLDNNDYDLELLRDFYRAIVPYALKNEKDISSRAFLIMEYYYKECCIYVKECDVKSRNYYTVNIYRALCDLYTPSHKDVFKNSLKIISLQLIQDLKSSDQDLKDAAELVHANPFLKRDLREVYEKNKEEFDKIISNENNASQNKNSLLNEYFLTLRLIYTEDLTRDNMATVFAKYIHYSENFEHFTPHFQDQFLITTYELLEKFYLPHKSYFAELKSKIAILVEQVQQGSESTNIGIRRAAQNVFNNSAFAADASEVLAKQKAASLGYSK